MTAQRREAEAENRVLALDPTSRGLGFAVLEGAARLIDWGTKDAGRADSMLALRHVAALLDHYRPDAVVVEDVRDRGTRRCRRVKAGISWSMPRFCITSRPSAI